jgi:hypothetical protein
MTLYSPPFPCLTVSVVAVGVGRERGAGTSPTQIISLARGKFEAPTAKRVAVIHFGSSASSDEQDVESTHTRHRRRSGAVGVKAGRRLGARLLIRERARESITESTDPCDPYALARGASEEGRLTVVHRFAAAWVRVRAAFGDG